MKICGFTVSVLSVPLILGSPGPTLIHLRNCSVDTLPQFIRAKCVYPGNSDAMVTGFQVIAQPTDFDQLALWNTQRWWLWRICSQQQLQVSCNYVLLLGLYLLITFYLYIIGNIADTELRKDIFFGNRKY